MNSAANPGSAFHSIHDFDLVVLAALICLFACYTALTLLENAREPMRSRRWLWRGGSALVAGCGAWATHFVGMLAWRPEFEIGYDLSLTIWSVALAVAGAWVGNTLMLNTRLAERTGAAMGGAVTGGAIAAMHYLGMAAVRMPATIHQDRLAMAVS